MLLRRSIEGCGLLFIGRGIGRRALSSILTLRRGVGRTVADCVVEVLVQETGLRNNAYGADRFGFKDLKAIHRNHTAPLLYEHAIAGREATVVQGGALCAETGAHTGRSPKDKHTVVDALTENTVWWGGNRKITPQHFQRFYDDLIQHARGKTLYAQHLYGGADPNYRIKTRVFTERAWHSLFIRQLLFRPEGSDISYFITYLSYFDLSLFSAI